MLRLAYLNEFIYNSNHKYDQVFHVTSIVELGLHVQVSLSFGAHCIYLNKGSDFAKKISYGDKLILNRFRIPDGVLVLNSTKYISTELIKRD